MFNFVKECYSKGLYTDDDMALLVKAGMITQEQYDSVKTA